MALSISITKPTVGGSSGSWGTELNTALDVLVAGFNTDVQDELDLKAALAGATFTGAITISSGGLTISAGGADITGDVTVDGAFEQGADAVISSTGNATLNIDLSQGNVWSRTLITDDFSIPNPTNIPDGFKLFWLRLQGSGGGTHTISFGGNWRVAGGGITTFNVTNSGAEFLCVAADGRVYIIRDGQGNSNWT